MRVRAKIAGVHICSTARKLKLDPRVLVFVRIFWRTGCWIIVKERWVGGGKWVISHGISCLESESSRETGTRNKSCGAPDLLDTRVCKWPRQTKRHGVTMIVHGGPNWHLASMQLFKSMNEGQWAPGPIQDFRVEEPKLVMSKLF